MITTNAMKNVFSHSEHEDILAYNELVLPIAQAVIELINVRNKE